MKKSSRVKKLFWGGFAVALTTTSVATASPVRAAATEQQPAVQAVTAADNQVAPDEYQGIWPAVDPAQGIEEPVSTDPAANATNSAPATTAPETSDTSEADTSEADTTAPDTSEADTTAPETTDTSEADTTAPETTDTSEADTTAPETSEAATESTVVDPTGIEAIEGESTEVNIDDTPEVPPFDLVGVASGFLSSNSSNLGVSADTQFVSPQTSLAGTGGYVVRYDETVAGLPLFGGGAVVRVDAQGGLMSLSTKPTPGVPQSGIQPKIDNATANATAQAAAIEAFKKDGVPTDDVKIESSVLSVYDPDMVGGDPNGERFDGTLLVWDITVTSGVSGNQRILVDAITGENLLSFSQIAHALKRDVCDINNKASSFPNGPCYRRRQEGQRKTGVSELDNAYTAAGVYYNFFKKRFNRNSWNGRGATFRMLTRVCQSSSDCPMKNAFWSPSLGVMMMGDRVSSDDVIAHEITHAVTTSTADLLYYAESGAMNESFSDVFGELVDLSFNPRSGYGHDTKTQEWLIGEGTSLGVIRSMRNPPKFGHPDRMQSPLYRPTGTFYPAFDHWGVHTNSGVNNKAAFLISDGGKFNGQTIAGIGRYKASLVYYETLNGLLTKGSDYLDLYYALPKACKNLVRTRKVTSNDCRSVNKAVIATQMNKAAAQRKTASKCPSGKPWPVYAATAEGSMTMVTGSSNAPKFRRSREASTQGYWSYFMPMSAGNSRDKVSWMRTRDPIFISRKAPSYLYFSHSFSFNWGDPGYRPASDRQGGVIEYSTDGKRWKDLGTANGTRNGYDGTIYSGPLKGRKGFTYQSKGFEQVRIPVSFLRGQFVHFRWKYASSTYPSGDNGWYIDDISVNACANNRPNDTSFLAGRFTPRTPRRLFDTRTNRDSLLKIKLGRRRANSVTTINLTDLSTIRYGDRVTAVALNVTGVNAAGSGYIAAFPCGSPGGTATVNITRGPAAGNSAIIPVSPKGTICFKTSTPADIIADITGYFSSTRQASNTYRTINPKRVFDTRSNRGNLTRVKLGKRNRNAVMRVSAKSLGIYRKGDNPTALVVNLTTVGSSRSSFATVYPCADGVPKVSTVNMVPGKAITNSAIVPVDKNGRICIRPDARTHLILDVSGYFTPGSSGFKFAPITPRRAVDTREGQKPWFRKIVGLRKGGQTTRIPLGSMSIYSRRKPAAVAGNFTSVGARGGGFLKAWPCAWKAPRTSINNFAPWPPASASSAFAGVDPKGKTCVYSSRPVDIVADITGYFY